MAAPEALVAARFGAVDAAFRRLLGGAVLASAEMRRAALLARTAAEEAGRRPEARPLAAAHAGLGWPDEPHLQLWHAQSILREFRGDGHVALLVVHGLSGIEALVTHAAAGDVPAHVLRTSRGWSQEAWDAAVDGLRGRGWLQRGDGLRFTEWGAAQRRAIEEGTDALAAAPYAALGDDGCAELRALARPWSMVFADQFAALKAASLILTGDGRNCSGAGAPGRLAQLVRAARVQTKTGRTPCLTRYVLFPGGGEA